MYKDKPTHGVAQMRPEMQFEEFQPGVGDWSGPGEGGCCGGSVSNEVEKIKRVRRPRKNQWTRLLSLNVIVFIKQNRL